MRKRLLSLFLAVVMILLAVPTLAIVSLAAEAGTEEPVYSTTFSSDPSSKNYPILALPTEIPEDDPNTSKVDESKLHHGGYYYGGIGNLNADGSLAGAACARNVVTWQGNWEVGAIKVNWASTSATKVAPTVDATVFTPYTDITRQSNTEIGITHENAVWDAQSATKGAGWWLTTSYGTTAGLSYKDNPDKSLTGNNCRVTTAYLAACSIRYTAEHAGLVSIDLTFSSFNSVNGVDLVVLHNGVEVYRVLNEDMTRSATAYGTAKDEEGDVISLLVAEGDAIDFVTLGDPYYDYTNCLYEEGKSSFVYNESKRGFRDIAFTVNYSEIYPSNRFDADTMIDFTMEAGTTVASFASDPNNFLFVWYDKDGNQLTPGSNKLSSGCYATINPVVKEAAGIEDTDTYYVATNKFSDYLKTKCVVVDYTGDWEYVSVNKTSGSVKALKYPLLVHYTTPFMTQKGSATYQTYPTAYGFVSEDGWKLAMDAFFAASWQGNVLNTDGAALKSGTPVGDIGKLTFDSITTISNAPGWSSYANTYYKSTYNPLYVRPQHNADYATKNQAIGLAYTATMYGKMVLSLPELAWATETDYPYFGLSFEINGKPIVLNTEGLISNALATTRPNNATPLNTTDLQTRETGIYCDAAKGYVEIKVGVPTGNSNTRYDGTANSGDAWYAYLSAVLAQTKFTVAPGDQIVIYVWRGNAMDTRCSENQQNSRPTDVKIGAAAIMTELNTKVGAQLVIDSAYAVNGVVYPQDPEATEVGVDIWDEEKQTYIRVPGEKQTDGTYKVILKDNIKVFELTYAKDSKAVINNTLEAGTTIKYLPYEESIYTCFNNSEITTITRDLLNGYIDNVDAKYDDVTVALAKRVRAMAIAAADEYAYYGNTTVVVDNDTKLYIKGEYNANYKNLTREKIVEILKDYYKDDELIQGITDETPLYDYTGKVIGSADLPTFTHTAAREVNLILQAYKEHFNSDAVLATMPGNDYRIWVGTFTSKTDGSTAYELPYYWKPTLSEEEIESITKKYTNAEGITLTDADVKDESQYGYKIVAANVNLGDEISLVFLANANGENNLYDLKKCTLKITTANGATYDGEFYEYVWNNVTYMGVIVDVPIAFYNDSLDIVIVDKANQQEVSAHLQYNVLTYCARMFPFDNNYVIRAVYGLGQAAKEFLAKHPATNA